jgi:DNA-binding MurR/RpiR family transcriptional regulator
MNSLEPKIVCCAMAARIGQKFLSLTKAEKKIAEYVLSNAFLSATLSIDELASEIGISVATMSRFVRSLDFDGYAQFRLDLMTDFRSIHAPSYDTQSVIASPSNSDHVAAFTLEEHIENLESTRRSIRPDLYNQAVQMISKSNRVYIVGYGVDAFLAGVMAHNLESPNMTIQSTLDSGGFSNATKQLSKYTESDLVVALSFSDFADDIVTLLRQVSAKKIPIIVMTNTPNSPLGSIANLTLCLPAHHHLLPNLKGAVLCFIEAVCCAVNYQEKTSPSDTQELTESYSLC